MARLTVSPELRNRNSVLTVARVQFAAGENPTLDSVVSQVFVSAEEQAYEASIVREYEEFGSFGGQY